MEFRKPNEQDSKLRKNSILFFLIMTTANACIFPNLQSVKLKWAFSDRDVTIVYNNKCTFYEKYKIFVIGSSHKLRQLGHGTFSVFSLKMFVSTQVEQYTWPH
jgi:hypothetical protein